MKLGTRIMLAATAAVALTTSFSIGIVYHLSSQNRVAELLARLDEVIAEYQVSGVVHVAGFKYAGVSVQRPLHTYEQNVTGMQVLLDEVLSAGIENFVFSSSAAVYGSPERTPITEEDPLRPINPYGSTKKVFESLLEEYAKAYGIHFAALRYFNDRAGSIYSGSNEIQRNILAKATLGL